MYRNLEEMKKIDGMMAFSRVENLQEIGMNFERLCGSKQIEALGSKGLADLSAIVTQTDHLDIVKRAGLVSLIGAQVLKSKAFSLLFAS